MQRKDHNCYSDQRVNQAVEAELTGRAGKLRIDRLQQNEIEFAGADQLGQIHQIHIEECLEKLADDLMGSDKQNHLPFCPITYRADLAVNYLDKHQLSDKPERFNDEPQRKIQLEIHLPDQGVAEHDPVDRPVFSKD
jgi:hypothetical protein